MISVFDTITQITWQQIIMFIIGGVLIYLAIKKKYEPSLLLPIGFGTIMVNLPLSGVMTQEVAGIGEVKGIIEWLYDVGIASSEAMPILLFIGIGAMIDFRPLLAEPIMFIFGIMAQGGIVCAILLASFLGFDIRDAASIGMIGAADGPTSILVSQFLHSQYVGAIAVMAYSYMALVPIIQPAAIRLVTTKKERQITMSYKTKEISKRTCILFPIIVTVIVGIIAPYSLALVGFLMFGNLIRECGVLDDLSDTAQNVLTKLITLLLGITISFRMSAGEFVSIETFMIMGIGLFAFVMDTIIGVLTVKVVNIFRKNKMNPMIGAAGISAFPMSARVVQKMAQEEKPGNIIIMHAVGANVAGQIASAVAGGLVMGIVAGMLH